MALPLIAAGVSLLPSLFGGIRGGKQRREAERLRRSAVDPGYQMNQGVIDNARVLQERASNYSMPGYQQALSNINQSYGNAFNQGVQGASSSGDVLDLASRIAYGQGQATNELAFQNAQGAEQAQLQSLQANAQAGQQYQDANAYQRGLYQQQLAEAAALYNAGEQNVGNALQDVASVGTGFLMNQAAAGQKQPQEVWASGDKTWQPNYQTGRRMLNPNIAGQYQGLQQQGGGFGDIWQRNLQGRRTLNPNVKGLYNNFNTGL